jgi:hypothetical protein
LESDTDMRDVENRIKKRNSILFSQESLCLQDLINMMQMQNHRTLVMWALHCAKTPLMQFETKYPQETRPGRCLKLCEEWARGRLKMPVAKQAILASHAVAKEIDDGEYGALCHAIGHAGATVHVGTHAIGLPMYELTAIVLRCGNVNYAHLVHDKIKGYYASLLYWKENMHKQNLVWADFLQDDALPDTAAGTDEKMHKL